MFYFQRTVEKRLSLFLREGHWFVSLYNDFGDAQTVDMVAALALEMTEGCPNGCNGHGECVLGRCQCESGYGGEDCSQGNSQFPRFKNKGLIVLFGKLGQRRKTIYPRGFNILC